MWSVEFHLGNIQTSNEYLFFWELFQALKTVNTNPGLRCCVNQERCVEIFEFFPF